VKQNLKLLPHVASSKHTLGSYTLQSFNAHLSCVGVTRRLPSSVRVNSQQKQDAFPVGLRDFCSWQSMHESEEYCTPFQIHMILQTSAFCTFPTRMTPLAPFHLTHCFQSSPIPVFSFLPNLLLFTSLLLFTGFSLKFQTLFSFFHLVSSTFQVTPQHPFSHQVNAMPPVSFTVILRSPPTSVLYMQHPFLLTLKISKKAVFLSSLGKIFPSYRKVRIRKIKQMFQYCKKTPTH